MNTEKVRHIPRFSLVRYEGHIYMLENKPRKPMLINGDTGIELDNQDVELEVIKYPAQLAGDYLETANKGGSQ